MLLPPRAASRILPEGDEAAMAAEEPAGASVNLRSLECRSVSSIILHPPCSLIAPLACPHAHAHVTALHCLAYAPALLTMTLHIAASPPSLDQG